MLKKRMPKKDPPEVVRARELMRPVDRTELTFDDPSIPEAWDFCWVHHGEDMMGLYSALGFVPVEKKKWPGIKAQKAFGNQTDNRIHHADTILCMRPIEIGRKEAADRLAMQQYETKMRYAGNQEFARELGVKKFSEKLTVGEAGEDVDEDEEMEAVLQ